MKDTRNPLITSIYPVALTLTLLAGVGLRVWHLFSVGFSVPFNLGGLFYQMSVEIINHHFSLPVWIPYYFKGGLPFAYPPLPLYIQALLIKGFHPNGFLTENLLPPLFSILSLFFFYLLARKVFSEKWRVLTAVLIFSSLPAAFTEQIEAQGLCESAGTLALILYVYALLWANERQLWWRWIFPGVAFGVCILSSPGSIYASILISFLYLSIMLFSSIKIHRFHFVLNCLTVAMVGLFVSAPYWATIVNHHGIEIFINAFTSQNEWLFGRIVTSVINMQVLSASKFWNILFFLSLVVLLVKRELILFFFSVVLLLVPRESWVMSIPASLAIGSALYHLINLPKVSPANLRVAIQGVVMVGVSIMIASSSIGALGALINRTTYDLSEGQIQDLTRIQQSNLIPPRQPVIVVGSWGQIEWAPALLEREVLNNHFGLEWMPMFYEKNREMSEKLLNATTINEISELVIDVYADTPAVYLVADRAFFQRLNLNPPESRASFSLLQDFDELSLGMITFQ